MNIDSLHLDPALVVGGAAALVVLSYLVRWWWTSPIVAAVRHLETALARAGRHLPPAP